MTLHAWLTARELEPLRKHLAGGHDQLALVMVLLVVIVTQDTQRRQAVEAKRRRRRRCRCCACSKSVRRSSGWTRRGSAPLVRYR